MNFLAHMLLSYGDSELMAGNFMADFMLMREQKTLHTNIKKGIDLHRLIDSFTDEHVHVKSAVTILRPSQGKYSPVVIDILFDYFLTVNWHRYSEEKLDDFNARVYSTLTLHREVYPQRLKELLSRMIEDDFLMSCKDEDRLIKTFERIKRRAKFDNNFDKAVLDLVEYHHILDHHFNEFFPEIILHVNQNFKS
jgi:acyl carrier protein phosphodiesterase